MSFKKLASILLSAAIAVCVTSTASSAQTVSKVLSGVAFGGSSKATSTLVTPDPAYGIYPSYLVNTFKSRFDCGWNLPEVGKGSDVLPDIGKFNLFNFHYLVPNLGGNADSGLVVVIQTTDGFSRAANTSAILNGAVNGYNDYLVNLAPSSFSPPFSPNQKTLRTISVRYNGAIGPIHLLYPIILGQNSILSSTDFSSKALPDPIFNNR